MFTESLMVVMTTLELFFFFQTNDCHDDTRAFFLPELSDYLVFFFFWLLFSFAFHSSNEATWRMDNWFIRRLSQNDCRRNIDCFFFLNLIFVVFYFILVFRKKKMFPHTLILAYFLFCMSFIGAVLVIYLFIYLLWISTW